MHNKVGLWTVGLLLAAPTALIAADERPQTRGVTRVDCFLEVEQKVGSNPKDFTGRLVLKNNSDDLIEITYRPHPLIYLDLDVRDEAGKSLPKALASYGFIYSPASPDSSVLKIAPGKTYEANVSLFMQVDQKQRPITPGKYTIEAVYKWGGKEFRSQKVAVEVREK